MVRCREVRGHPVRVDELRLEDYIYHPACAEEHFLSFVTADDRLAGYLRLSLPGRVESCDEQAQAPLLDFPDLEGAALIREVHVYGQSLAVGAEKAGAAQHAGLGDAPAAGSRRARPPPRIPAPGGHCRGGHALLLRIARLPARPAVHAQGALSAESTSRRFLHLYRHDPLDMAARGRRPAVRRVSQATRFEIRPSKSPKNLKTLVK